MHQGTKRVIQSFTTGGVASAFFGIFQGRCTLAAICFAVVGVWGWLHGKDLTSYSIFVAAIQGLLVLHSWKSDVAEQRSIGQQAPVNTKEDQP